KFLEERGLVGRVTTTYLKKKWENLKQKYKDLKDPPTGLSTEGGKATAASWKWFDLMHEAIGDRPSVTPPVVIATRASTSSRASTPKKRRVDVAEALQELRRQDEQEWRRIHEEEKEREDRREAERARQAAEREENEQRGYRQMCERQERFQQEAAAREERWREEMRARDDRRDQEAAARDERFLAILEMLAKK
ncbi:unnamed protein product, partial [Merluccius merluccius]